MPHDDIKNLLRLVIDIFIETVAQYDDRKIVLNETIETCIVAMPPSIMINDIDAIRVVEHSPSEAIIFDTAVFKTLGCIGFF